MPTKTINIPISNQEEKRLTRLALYYGLSLPKLISLVLEEISHDLETESFDDYDNPRELKASFIRSIKDWQAGKVSETL